MLFTGTLIVEDAHAHEANGHGITLAYDKQNVFESGYLIFW